MSQTFDPNAILFIHPSHPSMRRRRYLRRFRAWMRALALLILLCLIYPAPAVSETLRLASYTAALERNAPGLLYRDILYGKSSQIRAALRLIATIKPDVLALQRFDWDAELRAARAFQSALKAQGWEMQNLLAPRPNTGVATGVDIDGNGQIGGPGDAQSYGIFAGQRGLLLLSRLPFDVQHSQDHSQVLWAEVPQTQSTDPPEIAKVQRLADMRNVGQGFELVVNLPSGPYSGDSRDSLLDAYAQAYQAHFTRPPPNVPTAIAAIRVRLTAPIDASADGLSGQADDASAQTGQRPVYFPETDGMVTTPIYDRTALAIDQKFEGPAVVEEAESTMVIGPGGRFHVSNSGNLIIDLPEDEA